MTSPPEIVIFCDRCGLSCRADYLVTEEMTPEERYAVARAYLRAQGWSHSGDPDRYTDLCRSCTVGCKVTRLADGTFEVMIEDPDSFDMSAGILRIGMDLDRLRELWPEINSVLGKTEDS